ncbi:MAG TPA: flippase-like domain-containing protein [Gaiellales bacterium]|nr:flippase-like domain-containing protein [Gaiellales bacterium]
MIAEVAEADSTRSVGETLRGADVALLVAAAVAEAWRYLFSGALLRLLTGFQYAVSIRISTAALAIGALIPGANLPGGGIAFRELRRRGIPRRRALAVSTALVLVVPAASLALLAGPALLISGTHSNLPPNWRVILDLLGIAALMLAAAILLVVAVGRRAHHAPASLGFGIGAWLGDAACLWLVAAALHIDVDTATIPVAFLAAAAIMAIPAVPGGVGTVEAAVPFILATGSTSYADAALAVLAWRVLSFWLPTIVGAGSLATLRRRSFPLRTA